jgi:hypothetical protein
VLRVQRGLRRRPDGGPRAALSGGAGRGPRAHALDAEHPAAGERVPDRRAFAGHGARAYYITSTGEDFENEEPKALISSYDEAEAAYKEGTLKIHNKVITRRNGERLETTLGRVLFNENVEQT